MAIAIVRSPRPGPGAFLGAGGVAGLAVLSKITGLAALAVAVTLWAIDRGRPALAAVLAGLLWMNLSVLGRFRAFHAPGERVEGANRDYATFRYTQVKDRDRAQRYLRRGR